MQNVLKFAFVLHMVRWFGLKRKNAHLCTSGELVALAYVKMCK